MFAIKATFSADDVQISTVLFETVEAAQATIDNLDPFQAILATKIEIIQIPTLF